MATPDPRIAGGGAGLLGLKAAGISIMPMIAVSTAANSCHVGASLMLSSP